METQANSSGAINHWFNKLEPDYLLQVFFDHPPIGFNAAIEKNGLPVFSAKFDISTTMSAQERRRLKVLPFYRFWSRIFHFNTLFVGTTVTEFCPIPSSIDTREAARFLKAEAKDGYSLVVVKDLPQQSVLTNEDEAEKNRFLIQALQDEGFLSVEGQALAYVPVDYLSLDDYLSRFSKSRRKDFRRKMRAFNDVNIEVLKSDALLLHDKDVLSHFYELYRQVYEQSDIHFDLLSQEFFCALMQSEDDRLRVFVYRDNNERIIGFNICFVINDTLVDKYIGFDYPFATDNNLYYLSWFYNLEYARSSGLKCYIAGWTDPEIKSYLGAQFVYTRHMVFIRNPILRGILRYFRHHFEGDWNILTSEGSAR